jgi:hypothetical protein
MRVAQRSSRRARFPWAWFWLVVLCVELGAAVSTSPWTGLRAATVDGAVPRDRGWIAATLAPLAGRPVMRLDTRGLQATILSEPRIEHVELTRGIDGRLAVRLGYRTPFARVRGRQWLADVDRTGVPFQRSADPQPFNIYLRGDTKVVLGKRLPELDAPLEVLLGVGERHLADSADVTVDPDGEICLNLGASAPVLLGAGERIPEKLDVLRSILDREPGLLDAAEYLNLKCPEAPAIRRTKRDN